MSTVLAGPPCGIPLKVDEMFHDFRRALQAAKCRILVDMYTIRPRSQDKCSKLLGHIVDPSPNSF